jgi:aryl-alcohol dehydrogenase-like predicted oxidoreductase
MAMTEGGRRGAQFGMDFDYSYAGVMRQHEDSLQRLGLPAVDCLVSGPRLLDIWCL